MTDKKQIHINLPAELLDRIRKQAERERRSVNGQIVVMLEKELGLS